MPGAKRTNKSKKNRKHGRNEKKCKRYAEEHRRTKNNPARTQRKTEQTPH